MTEIVVVWLLVVVGLVCNVNVLADKGSVGISHVEIPIYEPGQKAIICWDGTEELLILTTDIKASQPTKALEILPLPSEPKIQTCNISVFETLKSLVEWGRADSKEAGGLGTDNKNEEPPEVEIIFHEKLGVHNITVIKAYTSKGFANWVNTYMTDIGLTPMSFPEAEMIASAYMDRNINYFVLDVIELTNELKSPETLMYSFNSTTIYYPMEITSLVGGETHILLFILTPHKVVKGPYRKTENTFFSERVTTWQNEWYIDVKTPKSPVNFHKITDTDVSTERLKREAENYYEVYDEEGVDDDFYHIYEFFKDHEFVKVGVYEYDGPVEMKGDISINEYSIQTIKLDEEYSLNVQNLMYAVCLPPVIIIIILIVLSWYMKQKMEQGKNYKK